MGEVQQLALVVPWYGPDTAGGAEIHARRLVQHLHQIGVSIVVLTTTAKEVYSPESHRYYPTGWQELDGVPVLRFPARGIQDPGRGEPPMHLLPELPPLPEVERHMVDGLRVAESFYEFIAAHREDSVFLLTPYIWGTTFWGCLVAREQGILIPCLHDEPHAYYSIYKHMFRTARGCLFLSEPEMELALQLYGLSPAQGRVVGAGMTIPAAGDAAHFRRRFGVEGPFLFFAGRRDFGKRVDMLIEYFCAYKDRHPGPLRLVLAGKYPVSVPLGFADQVIDLGYLPETDKQDAYAAGTIVCQPSMVESFSLVLMESWLQGTPVLVNGECDVTVWHCRQSNGGLYFRGYLEFEACLNYLLERPILRDRMGALGREYVYQNYTWPAVVQRTVAALEELGVQVPYRSDGSPPRIEG